jgi:hypothetical protein
VTLRGTLGTALLITLTRPGLWVVALAAFLIRGGIVWFLVPILVVPTPVGLANTFGPSIVDFVFGGLTLGLILLLFAGAAGILAWLIGGGLAAAGLELALVREVAGDEALRSPGDPTGAVRPAPPAGRTLRVLAVRLIALAPLLVALVFGATRIVAATYDELTLPGDAGTPLVWRVLADVPDVVIVIAIAWVVGEVVGALAARRVGLGDPSIVRAVWGAVLDVVRHPVRMLVLYAVPTVILVLVLVPAAVASSAAWSGLRSSLADPASGLVVAIALIAFVALWAGGLVLAGAVCAWRSATWSVAAIVPGRGTFGGSETGRPGDWNVAPSSGTV